MPSRSPTSSFLQPLSTQKLKAKVSDINVLTFAFPHPHPQPHLHLSRSRDTMKMMKAMKRLKFWLRKKKKKKQQHFMEHRPIPPRCQCQCHYHCHRYCPSPPLEPSAPPLPTWLDTRRSQGAVFAGGARGNSSETDELSQQEIVLGGSDIPLPALLPIISYQQYMTSNPVNGIPAATTRERNAGVFGCVVDIGIHLIACFCPCCPIREVHCHKINT